jgi:hypothetical protein
MQAEIFNIADHNRDKEAREIGMLYQKGRKSRIESVNYFIQCGQRLRVKKKELQEQSPQWISWLEDNSDVLGFHKRTAQKLMALAKKAPPAALFSEAEALALSRSLWDFDTSTKAKSAEKPVPIQNPKIAEALEAGRTQLLKELNVDPETLSMSAQSKLEVAKRAIERQVNTEHASRMRNLDEEVRQRVLSETKDYLAMLKGREEEATKTIETYREFTNNHQVLFTLDQFKTILMCLHPDGQRTPEKLAEAFRLFNAKKFQLTGER